MLTTDQLQNITGTDALDDQGQKIGSIGQVYLDDTSGQPEWVTVKTGLFGTKESFVPIEADSVQDDGVLRIPSTRRR